MASGGAWQEAQRKAWFEPFAKKIGIKFVEQEYLGDLGKIKAMVETGNVPIDLVTVETATVLQGCDAGMLIRLDYSKIADRSKFLPARPWTAASASMSMAMSLPTTRPC